MDTDKIGRPEFLFRIYEGALTLALPAFLIAHEFAKKKLEENKKKREDNHANDFRLLFYPNEAQRGVSFIHPVGHETDSATKQFKESVSAREFAEAYAVRFASTSNGTTNLKDVPKGDGVITLASPAGNGPFRRMLYGSDDIPIAPRLQAADPSGSWQTALRWSFYQHPNAGDGATPEIRKVVHSEMVSGPRKSKRYVLRDQQVGRDIESEYDVLPGGYTPPFDRSEHHLEYETRDWLLVTVLPRGATGRHRLINFGGLHRPATRAAAKLFGDGSATLAKDLKEAIDGANYFQALFSVETELSSTGEALPKFPKLYAAQRLDVDFKE